ncbi:MAG: RluA family pseudouridine synthase [Butyricicoccus pullicaecorum]|nr:RluA family pseudouridine synthase [Butyricicoccus pullicaecorum]
MKEFHIKSNDSGQRLNKFLEKAVPALPCGLMHKYIRCKRIKVNGKRTEPSYKLCTADLLQLYINDEFFETPDAQMAYEKISTPQVRILYEDSHILLADKQAGMVVHADERGDTDTLIAHIQAYLVQNGEWDPKDEASFIPSLCNRIDRNTGGIVIAAKTAEALRIMNDKIRDRELIKRYLCVVHGVPKIRSKKITHYLRRDESKKQVEVFSRPMAGAKTAQTIYKVLASRNGLSLVECTLLTGRTHQIRAQMAAIGHPLLGDGKYGSNARNAPFGETSQLLYSYQLTFDFKTDSGVLNYLNGSTFTVHDIPFVHKYFPNFQIR